MKRLISVGSRYFLFTRVYCQIKSFKRDSAEKDFIGGRQDKRDADCPAVIPDDFQRARDIESFFYSVREGTGVSSDYLKAELITDSLVYNQRPCAGINQSLNSGLPDFVLIFNYSGRKIRHVDRVFKSELSMYY
jgi:hypothetical protein